VARDFHPSLVYHKEGYKAFPGRLAPLMKAQGYAPRFFYGGVAAWHRLYQFVPALGYASFSAEHSYPDRPHHEHGLYDGDLLEEVLSSLRAADAPTFSFVMTLTNHPPFSVPAGEAEPKIAVPKALQALMLDDPAQLERRFIAYRYADRSLQRFVRGLAAAGLDKDTLVVVTGDHAFSGGLGFPAEFGWKAEQVPLLFWGPGILKPEVVGSRLNAFTTHLDLAPTLVSLTTEAPVEIQSFGKVVFDRGSPAATGINHYFSCKEGACLKDGRLSRLDASERLIDVDGEPGAGAAKRAIEAMERAYFGAAMSYLYSYEEPDSSALAP
jgi:phosphoglycerol transferase MdoB-like AlkP superfamily enzyme